METVPFNKLLLKTAFCCMASDGSIDQKEIDQIKLMYEKSELFHDLDFHEEINRLIDKINTKGKDFIKYYLNLLSEANLSEQEELMLIDFAIETIHSDGVDDYSEIKFFKNIRHRLNLTDEKILNIHPEVEYWLEQDIITESYLEKISKQYLEEVELPQFESISLENISSENGDMV